MRTTQPQISSLSTLLDVLHHRSQIQSDRQAYIFIKGGETESDCLTYGELEQRAKTIAASLQNYRGERVLLLYPSGLEFIAAFFGCLLASAIAVPVYPPKPNQKLERLRSIVDDAGASVALSESSVLSGIEKQWDAEPRLKSLNWLASDRLTPVAETAIFPASSPDEIALPQYTSGSTGNPKGVIITHGNLMHNCATIEQCFGDTSESIGISWLPPYHDMGLVGGILQPLYLGGLMVLMSPIAFLMRPLRWLQAISRYRATTSGAPNFAYDLCVQKVKPEQLANLDLSCWRVAFNGAGTRARGNLKAFCSHLCSEQFSKKCFLSLLWHGRNNSVDRRRNSRKNTDDAEV